MLVTPDSTILVGTCNWADHEDFYRPRLPANERLRYYAQFFPIVEVDSTFYGIPKPSVPKRWSEQTPDDFKFNVKAYRSLTLHEREDGKPRRPTEEEEREFMDLLDPLRDTGKLRGVHYQFPPWFKAKPANMDYISELADKHPRDQLIVEFRHRSWSEPARFDAVTELLAEAGIAYCIVDEPQLGTASMPPHLAVTTDKLAVLRMHGRNAKTWYKKGETSADRFDYLYSEEELLEWVPRVRQLADRAKEVHVLFNNNRSNYAVVNGLQMAKLLDLGYPTLEEMAARRGEGMQQELPLG
ncbi:MAG TPA: DUF72 domain-containing protein [Candidatus Dormibacteraeota bacterium]|nr:DUF72 domain-containing protein [Candidatus Dormibacteraeota bacterium]